MMTVLMCLSTVKKKHHGGYRDHSISCLLSLPSYIPHQKKRSITICLVFILYRQLISLPFPLCYDNRAINDQFVRTLTTCLCAIPHDLFIIPSRIYCMYDVSFLAAPHITKSYNQCILAMRAILGKESTKAAAVKESLAYA